MHSFTDSRGRRWELAITIGAAKRVLGLVEGGDLLNLDRGNPSVLARLGTDPIFVVDLICAVLRPQLAAAGVSDEDFAEALDGDADFAAAEAFFKELSDFTRRRGRADLALALDKQAAVLAKAVAMAEKEIAAIEPLETTSEATDGGTSTGSAG